MSDAPRNVNAHVLAIHSFVEFVAAMRWRVDRHTLLALASLARAVNTRRRASIVFCTTASFSNSATPVRVANDEHESHQVRAAQTDDQTLAAN